MVMIDPFLAGWALVIEFIFTLAMALKMLPAAAGRLAGGGGDHPRARAPEMVFHEAEVNFPVIMLLMFMVAGIYFLREMLLFAFTKILLGVRSKVLLSLMFSFRRGVPVGLPRRTDRHRGDYYRGGGFLRRVSQGRLGQAFDMDHDLIDRRGSGRTAPRGSRAISRLPAQADDARRGGYRARRRNDAGGRAAKPAYRRDHGLGVRGVLPHRWRISRCRCSWSD